MDTKGKRCIESAASNVQRPSVVVRTRHWVPPTQGVFRINVDAAFNQLSVDAAVRVVV